MQSNFETRVLAEFQELRGRLAKIETLLLPPKPSFDPKVFGDVREWAGPSYKDRPFSECPADLLNLMAEMYDRFAAKSEREGTLTKTGKPKTEWDKKLAQAARDWAKHAVPQGKTKLFDDATDQELPF